ncbi:transposase [Nocardioides houyundeii]|uniref:transposase n=1 Tax=Nocardioides houyundeii TaxID=2045452 RepID=UPI000C76533C|nr:transposase [Nocardioides houyundeii]
MRAIVLTADQRSSRSSADAVPDVLARLARRPSFRAFQRTAGDEIQGVLTAPESLAPVLEDLMRDGRWHVGLGLGQVETPLPTSTREGRGPAFVAAREAVTTARTAPWHLRVAGADVVSRHLESTLWLWAAVLDRRTEKGWQVVDLVDQGLSYEGAGERLGISQSAVSQRAAAAGLVEGRRARELVAAWAGQWLAGGDA